MYAPHDMTLYSAYWAPGATNAQWFRTELRGVMWSGSDAAKVEANAVKRSDNADAYIPFAVDAGGKAYASPKTWAAGDKAALWTLQTGDVMIKGIVPDEIPPSTTKELMAKYDNVLVVDSVGRLDFGSEEMRHFEITGK